MKTLVVVIGHGKLAGSILTKLGGVLHEQDMAVDLIGRGT